MHAHRHNEADRKGAGSFEKIDHTEIEDIPDVPQIGTSGIYLCHINFKKEVIMWLAVLVFVCLSVEVLSYLTEGETSETKDSSEEIRTSPETV